MCLEDDVKIGKIVIAVIYVLLPSAVVQGLTKRFLARGPKGSFDKNKWSKTGFRFINCILSMYIRDVAIIMLNCPL